MKGSKAYTRASLSDDFSRKFASQFHLGDPLGRSARDAILIIISSNSSTMSVLCFARCWTLVFLFLSMIKARFSMSSSIESSFGKNRNRDDFATTNTMTMTTNEGRTGDGERISEERTKTTTRRELLMSKDSEFGEKNKQKTPTYHTIFSTECNTYFDWQSLGLYYSFKKVKQKGEITRLMACDQSPPPGLDIVPNTHVHPNYAKHPVSGDRYSAYNKPYSIMHWMEHAKPTEDFIIVLDADMAFRRSMDADLLGVALGNPVSAHYGYLVGIFPKNHMGVKARVPNVEGAQQVGGFTVMHREDLEPLAPRWLYWTEQVRSDPDSWANTGDVFNQNGKAGPPWISEMYGYVFAAAERKLKFSVSDSFMLYPGYMPPKDARFPVVLHYGVTYRIDDYAFDKHWYQGTDMTSCTRGQMFEKPITIGEISSREGTMMRRRDEIALIVAETLYNSTKERALKVCKRTDLDFSKPRQKYDCSIKENNILRCKPVSREMIELKKIEEKLRGASGGSSCKDNNNQCCTWASTGECTNNPNYMSMECQLSCNLCPNTGCEDSCCPPEEKVKKEKSNGSIKKTSATATIKKSINSVDEYDYDASSSSTTSSFASSEEMDKEDEEDENELREEEAEIEEEARKQIEEGELIIESEGLRVSNGSSIGGLVFVLFVAFIVATFAKKLNLGGATKNLTPEALAAYKQANLDSERLKGRRE